MAMPNKLNLQHNKRNAYFTKLGKPRNNIIPSPPITPRCGENTGRISKSCYFHAINVSITNNVQWYIVHKNNAIYN
jgi:hypothetical protein